MILMKMLCWIYLLLLPLATAWAQPVCLFAPEVVALRFVGQRWVVETEAGRREAVPIGGFWQVREHPGGNTVDLIRQGDSWVERPGGRSWIPSADRWTFRDRDGTRYTLRQDPTGWSLSGPGVRISWRPEAGGWVRR
jgi:hypothetical protein